MRNFIESIKPVVRTYTECEYGWTEIGTNLCDMKNNGITFAVKKFENKYVMELDNSIEELCGIYHREIDPYKLNKILLELVKNNPLFEYSDSNFVFHIRENNVAHDFFYACSILLSLIGILYEQYTIK